jgi:ATP-binding cassette, subfamily F, member 1
VNAAGKSTIIKIITGEVSPPEGEVRRNPRLRIGVYNQHFVDRLPMEEDPVTYLRRLFNEETYQSIRNKLGKYGLEGHAHTIPIRDLSGGQKARVVFCELSLMAPHLLFLDEPTNNLDIESIDALCDALKVYNGGVILVSHDARLIETVECQLWVVEDRNVHPWKTGFQGYKEHLLKKLEDQLAAILPGSGERPQDK